MVPQYRSKRLGQPARHLTVFVAAAIITSGVPRQASAVSGLYMQLGVGYGTFTGSELTTVEDPSQSNDLPNPDREQCCPDPGLAAQVRLGFSILGFGGPEFGLLGGGWNIGGESAGGAGYVGGGARLYPLKFLSLTGLETADFPLDMGVGAMLGYTIVGQDFAYTGSFWDFDVHVDYKLTDWMLVGAKVDLALPNYGDFAFTSYKKSTGRCLDGAAEQIVTGDNQGKVQRDQAECAGRGPVTTFITPQLVFTFFLDILDV